MGDESDPKSGTRFPWQPDTRHAQSRDRRKGPYHLEMGSGGRQPGRLVQRGGGERLGALLSPQPLWWRAAGEKAIFGFRLASVRGLDVCVIVSYHSDASSLY